MDPMGLKDGSSLFETKCKLKLQLTLPETNMFAPENLWLEYDRFLLGPGLFQGLCWFQGGLKKKHMLQG